MILPLFIYMELARAYAYVGYLGRFVLVSVVLAFMGMHLCHVLAYLARRTWRMALCWALMLLTNIPLLLSMISRLPPLQINIYYLQP